MILKIPIHRKGRGLTSQSLKIKPKVVSAAVVEQRLYFTSAGPPAAGGGRGGGGRGGGGRRGGRLR